MNILNLKIIVENVTIVMKEAFQIERGTSNVTYMFSFHIPNVYINCDLISDHAHTYQVRTQS